MAYEQQIGRTNLFRNKNKTSDKHPDFKGVVQVEDGDRVLIIDVALWERKSEKAGDYFGLSANVKEEAPF